MHMVNWMAWFYWNPQRTAFTVPIIDRPVAWYGCLFVSGFILGYFIIIPILKRFLLQSKQLSSLDIANWSILINYLQAASLKETPLAYQILQGLERSEREELYELQANQTTPVHIQQAILAAFNHLLSKKNISREQLEDAFPQAFNTLSHVSHFLADRLCWFLIGGTVIGARLGTVFFYDWDLYVAHPLEIFKIWKGGLASHGGTVGVVIALYGYFLYVKQWLPTLSFWRLLDFVAVPVPLAAFFIRMGNFVNQEILGTPSSAPWAVLFGDPIDGSAIIPRHPVQLYEGLAYLLIFLLMYSLWKKRPQLPEGFLSGLLLVLIFSSRFVLEFWKSTQASILDQNSLLQMGQLLSLPFILAGLTLMMFSSKRREIKKNLPFSSSPM